MKVAYISPPYFSDVDLSLIPELQNIVDVDYFVQLSNQVKRGAAFNIDQLKGGCGVVQSSKYPELAKFNKLLDVNKMYVVNYMGNKWYSFESIKCGYNLFRKLRKEHYDVIHLSEFPHLADFFLYFLRKRLILTVHDPFPHSSVRSRRITFFRKIAFGLIRNFIILNKAQKEDFILHYRLKKRNVFESQLSIYNYLHIYDNHTNSTKVFSKEYVLFFGQVSSHKGVDYLLDAFDGVNAKFPDVNLVIAGKWKWNFDYSLFAEKDYIIIHDRFIPDNELVALIKGALFVVAPYLDATQSGVIMSSFAFNKPCIATNVGGLPEMVVDGQFGIIIPEKDSESIKEAIIKMLTDRELIKKYSENIKKAYSKDEKSWSRIANGMLKIYNSLK